MAFIPNPDNKPEVNHKDGNKGNNNYTNLEWVTESENVKHAYETKLTDTSKRKPFKKLSKKQIHLICKLLEENELTIVEIAKYTRSSRQSVSSIFYKERHRDISEKYNIENYKIKTEFIYAGDNSNKTIVPDCIIEDICKLIDEGKYSLPDISEITGVNYQTVRNVYYGTCRRSVSEKYNFMKTNKNPLYENKVKVVHEICGLLDQGYNTKEVSKILNVSRSIVRNILAGSSWFDISKEYHFMKKKITLK